MWNFNNFYVYIILGWIASLQKGFECEEVKIILLSNVEYSKMMLVLYLLHVKILFHEFDIYSRE